MIRVREKVTHIVCINIRIIVNDLNIFFNKMIMSNEKKDKYIKVITN